MPYKDPSKRSACKKAGNKARRDMRLAYVAAIKAGPCVDCGGCFHFSAMDFDHVRGEKVDDISKMVKSSNIERIDLEIAKCDLVCSNCHRVRTYKRRG